MYSTHNWIKSVNAVKFIKILKNKPYKNMTAVSKNVDFGVLADISHKYINTYHNSDSAQMRPIDVTSNSYTECNVRYNARNAKFEIDGHVRISKYKKCFAKDNAPSWSEEVFVINKIKNTVP